MAEQTKSISEVRQNLPTLSLNAQQRMERYVITNQGRPQSVLVGYDDYQKMRAATEILLDPRAKGSIRRGLAEQQAGQRLTVEEVRERLHRRKTVIAGEEQIAATLSGLSGLAAAVEDRGNAGFAAVETKGAATKLGGKGPGQKINIVIQKEGQEYNQGVGYLDDGTLVVVDDARRLIGHAIEITITSMFQTATSRIIFGRVDAAMLEQSRAIGGEIREISRD